MPAYEIEAMNSKGKTVRRRVEAGSKEDAIASVKNDGLFPTKLVRKLRFARYEDVLRCVTEGASAEIRFRKKVREAKERSDPKLYDECVA